MSANIIISTQTPMGQQSIPHRGAQRGRTGQAISQATGFPLIRMHRNKRPALEEAPALDAIGNGSHIIITGHGNTQLDFIQGMVMSGSMDEPASYNFELSGYRDLICNGSSRLMPGDTLNIALWICKGGNGGDMSSARQLAELFLERGINTIITCSVENINRFTGLYGDDENPDNKIKYRVQNTSDIRILFTTDKAFKECSSSAPVYISRQGGIEFDEQALCSIRHKVKEELLSDDVLPETRKLSMTMAEQSCHDSHCDEKQAFINFIRKTIDITLSKKRHQYGARACSNKLFSRGASIAEQIQVAEKIIQILDGHSVDSFSDKDIAAIKSRVSVLHGEINGYLKKSSIVLDGKSVNNIDNLVPVLEAINHYISRPD